MSETSDAVFTDRAHSPYRDDNGYQERAEMVADHHWETCSPEFVEWLSERDGVFKEYAELLIAAQMNRELQFLTMADNIRWDWQQFVVSCRDRTHWPMARKIAEEVAS